MTGHDEPADPDEIDPSELDLALEEYARRSRRFGR